MFANIFSKRHIQRKSIIDKAISPIVLENLEERRLFTTYSYTVPSGHTAAYLETAGSGEVNVYLDSPTGTLGHTFSNTTGMDIVDSGSTTGFHFYDRVAAQDKPTSDGTDQGIKVQGGSGGTLEIDAQAYDTEIAVTSSTTTSATIVEYDSTHSATGISKFGSGVNHLKIVANDAGGTEIDIAAADTPYGDLPAFSASTSLSIDTGSGEDDVLNLGGNGSRGEEVQNATVVTGAGDDTVNLGSDDDTPSTAYIDFGSGTEVGNGLGLGNELNIIGLGDATIEPESGSSHTVVVDTINDGDRGTVTFADRATVGDITVDSDALAEVEAPVTFASGHTFTLNGTADFTGSSATSSIDELDLGGTLNLDGDSDVSVNTLSVTSSGTVNAADTATMNVTEADVDGTLTFNLTTDMSGSSDVTVGTFNASSGTVIVQGGGDLTIQNSSTIDSLYIQDDGLVTMQPRNVDTTTAQYLTVDYLDVLSFTDDTTINGTVDLTNNGLIVGPTGTGQFGDVQAWITNAYDGGAWDGAGITSSTAAANSLHNTALGYASDSELTSLGDSSVDGQSLSSFDSSTVFVKYTYKGDLNLDGTVGLSDYNTINAHLGSTGADWGYGDVDYDGTVGLSDHNWARGNLGATGL